MARRRDEERNVGLDRQVSMCNDMIKNMNGEVNRKRKKLLKVNRVRKIDRLFNMRLNKVIKMKVKVTSNIEFMRDTSSKRKQIA
jgi:hypothetical protein